MKRSTVILLVVFLALVGLMLSLNQKESETEEAAIPPTSPIEFLFSDSEGLPTSIDIKSKTGKQTVIARNEAGAWVLKKPTETEADQASAEAAASQLTSLRIESRLEVAPEAAGLIPASYTLAVETTSGTIKSVRIGDLTPTGIGYYALIDGSNETLVIGRTGLDALLMLLESPPYVNESETSTP